MPRRMSNITLDHKQQRMKARQIAVKVKHATKGVCSLVLHKRRLA